MKHVTEEQHTTAVTSFGSYEQTKRRSEGTNKQTNEATNEANEANEQTNEGTKERSSSERSEGTK